MMVRRRIAAMFNLALCGEELTPLYRRTENPVKTFLANLQALFGKSEPPKGCSPEIAEDWQMGPADLRKGSWLLAMILSTIPDDRSIGPLLIESKI